MHRFGQKFDHGLLSATWHWKTRKAQRGETPDFKRMTDQSWRTFDDHLRMKLQEKYATKTKRPATSAATPVTHETEKRKTEKTTESKCVDNLSVGEQHTKLTEAMREMTNEVVTKRE